MKFFDSTKAFLATLIIVMVFIAVYFTRCEVKPAQAKVEDMVLINTIAMKILVEERRQADALEKIAKELSRIRRK
jgi:hypothetical protein